MATRRETAQYKEALRIWLREESNRSGRIPGEPLPPGRELAQRFNLSQGMVSSILRDLEEDGLLHTVARMGVFFGQRFARSGETFLICQPPQTDTLFQHCFEERIACTGGRVVTLSAQAVQKHFLRGELPILAGIFDAGGNELNNILHLIQSQSKPVPCVKFAWSCSSNDPVDRISFNDIEGGNLATRHLIDMGHHNIAFLAWTPWHTPPQPYLLWAIQRQQGYEETMREAGIFNEKLIFYPAVLPMPDRFGQFSHIIPACPPLIENKSITAVVAANDNAALALFTALREASVPSVQWPAVVGFDDIEAIRPYNITSLRLPWEQLGHVAAELLLDRIEGRLNGPPVHRLVSLRLLPRMSSYTPGSIDGTMLESLTP